ncbi:MAG: tRNA uridine-5-carboxymethylaminomethyl(34) synthesis GTPase MnmE [Dehalococcoidales bacterium]|nr:tRNA uridine-5-carboxymethylaminomethyl(34) synthesis GTPase MnmE [Dehalococcoidales bacterium]
MLDDTIAAISTPIGEGGIGIVRLSGPRALAIARSLFRRAAGGEQRRFQSHCLYYGQVRDPRTDEVVDEVLLAYMRAPHTYTREDVVEINCHGGLLPLQRTLELALRQGARLAQPGELTLRAFLNGRLDLAQAESVIDIVRARTSTGLRMAVDQLGGRLSAEIASLRREVLDVLAYLTVTVDFAEDDIPEQDVEGPLARALERLDGLLATADAGIIYRQGLQVSIVGRPNVGKSSLLNAILRENRAIVTPVPGTTRDTLAETLNLRGVPVVLVDTAGIRETNELVERLGVERSRQAIARADLALFVVDASEPLQDYDREIAGLLAAKPAVVVLNKVDLGQAVDIPAVAALLPERAVVSAAATSGLGIEEVEEAVLSTALAGRAGASDTPLVSNPRHKEALWRAREQLVDARESLAAGLPADFLTIDLTAAVAALGEITGESVTADLLETIFGQFCIGK